MSVPLRVAQKSYAVLGKQSFLSTNGVLPAAEGAFWLVCNLLLGIKHWLQLLSTWVTAAQHLFTQSEVWSLRIEASMSCQNHPLCFLHSTGDKVRSD